MALPRPPHPAFASLTSALSLKGRGERAAAIFTIGHSNHALEICVELLKTHEIALIADVRSSPYARYAVHFAGPALARELAAHGIGYIYLGKELGGRPEGAQFYDDQGHVLYSELAASPEFQRGLEKLLELARAHKTALLCAEEDPRDCHRRKLIGRVLAQRGVSVVHIRGDGRTQTEEELAAEEKQDGTDSGQLFLFDVAREEPWRSSQSVSPERRPGSSSGA
jgi:hypothetical protein